MSVYLKYMKCNGNFSREYYNKYESQRIECFVRICC